LQFNLALLTNIIFNIKMQNIIINTINPFGGLIMKGWNPFGKIDMEIGSFLKKSPFNKEYGKSESNLSISEGNKEKQEEEITGHLQKHSKWDRKLK